MRRGWPGASLPTIATVVASLAALTGALLPWLRTGQARRSAFALARSADALGFVDTPFRRTLVVVWYLVPFVTALALTAAVLRQPGVVAVAGALVGAMSIAAAWMFLSLAPAGGPGPAVALTGGVATLGSAGWLAWALKSRPAPAAPMEGVEHER